MSTIEVKLNSVQTSNDGILLTTDLGGCLVVAVYSEYADGTKEGILTHYAPFATELHLSVLKTKLRPNPLHRKSALFYKRKDSNVTTLSLFLAEHSRTTEFVQYNGYHERILFDVGKKTWQTSKTTGIL